MLTKFLINREYGKLWFAGAVSWVGNYVFDVTVVLWVGVVLGAGAAWAPAAVSGVLAAVIVPMVLIGPIAGVFVDRWDDRRTMLAADLIRMLLIAGLLVTAVLPAGTLPVGVQLTLIYIVVFVSNAVSCFFNPARYAVVVDIVEPDQRARASGLGQATMAFAGIIGPPIAAPLLFSTGVGWALGIDAISFGVSFVAVYAIRRPDVAPKAPAQTRTGVWSELRAGLTVVLQNRVVLVIIISAIVANFGAYLLNTLNVFFVIKNLHADAKLYGLLDTAFGVGAVVGAAVAGMVGQRLGLARTFWIGLLGTGLLVIAYSRASAFLVAIGLVLVLAVPLSAMNTVVAPIVMGAVERDKLGRVFGLLQPAVQVMSVLAIAVAGWLSSSVLRGLDATVAGVHFGTYDTIISFAGLLMAVSGVYAMLVLRRHRPVEAAPDEDRPAAAEPVAEPAQ